MKQLLYSPSMFGKINLYIQSRFKSSYGLALYENCIRYRGLPFTKWFEMETFRKLMGVPTENYTVFRDFKRRVLDKSVEEVNTYSDLVVEAELAREKRRVVRIRFALKERPKKLRIGTTSDETSKDDKVMADLRSSLIMQFGLSPEQTEQVLQDYSFDFIQEKIGIVESSKNYKQGKVKNSAGYLMSAFKNDFQPAKQSKNQGESKRREESIKQYNLQEIKRLAKEVETSYVKYREETIDRAVDALSQDEKEHFTQQFYQYAALSIETILKLQRKKYTRSTILRSPQIKGLFRQFALRTLNALHASLIPIEKFIDQFSLHHREAWYQYKLLEPNYSEHY
jgi:plasmid replication initiation protein